MSIADADDVLTRWGKAAGDVEPEITALVDMRLGDVERMIRRRLKKLGRDLDDDIASGDVDPEDVKQIEADAVLRLARNPDGYLSETDSDYTYTLRSDMASGKLEIPQTDWETLGVVQSRMSILVPDVVMP